MSLGNVVRENFLVEENCYQNIHEPLVPYAGYTIKEVGKIKLGRYIAIYLHVGNC